MTGAAGSARAPVRDARVVACARAAGVHDTSGGVARPLADRLERAAARRVGVVVASAVDGEPLVTTGRHVAARAPDALVRGLRLAMAATGAGRGVVAIEATARAARAALAPLLPDRAAAAAPGAEAELSLRLVPATVACGEPATLAADATGRAVGPGGDPLEAGVLVVDAAALLDLEAAVGAGAPVTRRLLTLAGRVAWPGVYPVALAATVGDAVALAGGPTCGPAWLAVAGGLLAGRVVGPDEPVADVARALIVLPAGAEPIRRLRAPLADHVRRALSACERCAACADVCPPRGRGSLLAPDRIVRAIAALDPVTLADLRPALDCTGCGVCDLACPTGVSPRRLVEAVARALAERVPSGAAAPSAPPADAAPVPARRLGVAVAALRLGLG